MPDITKAEWETLISNRAGTYAFLARLYRVEADQALLEQISSMDLSKEIEDSEIGEGYVLLNRYVEKTNENTLTELAIDYAKVFLGVDRGSGAFPYESVYTSDRILMSLRTILLWNSSSWLSYVKRLWKPCNRVLKSRPSASSRNRSNFLRSIS